MSAVEIKTGAFFKPKTFRFKKTASKKKLILSYSLDVLSLLNFNHPLTVAFFLAHNIESAKEREKIHNKHIPIFIEGFIQFYYYKKQPTLIECISVKRSHLSGWAEILNRMISTFKNIQHLSVICFSICDINFKECAFDILCENQKDLFIIFSFL